MKIPYRAAAAAAVVLLGFAGFAAPASAKSPGTQQTSVIYNSVVASPLPGNLPSASFEASAINQFGNEVSFSGTNRQLTNVVVTMSSWGCVTGHWYLDNCSTPAGATFSEPITLNIYHPPAEGSSVPGSLITSVTQTFAIPYRPSANNAKCNFVNADTGSGPPSGEWYDSSLKMCFNGLATNVTFNLGSVTVPDTIVYGIAYNTSDFGDTPYGQSAQSACPAGGCGYDSLNVALSQDSANVSVGSDPNPGTVWQALAAGPQYPYSTSYCDGTAAGDLLRLDSPKSDTYDPTTSGCWSAEFPPVGGAPYFVPAVQFKAGGGR